MEKKKVICRMCGSCAEDVGVPGLLTARCDSSIAHGPHDWVEKKVDVPKEKKVGIQLEIR